MTRTCFLGARPNRFERALYTRYLRDPRTPGAALELLFSAEWLGSNMRADIAAHCNITEQLEKAALRGGSRLVREALAGNTSVSGETVKVLRKSRSRHVVGELASNSALDGQVLRECVGKARGLGMSEGEIAGHGCVNASMPEDVVLSWLNGGDERARAEALSSPLCPRGDLWRYLTGEGANARSEGLDSRVFSGWSNADGSMGLTTTRAVWWPVLFAATRVSPMSVLCGWRCGIRGRGASRLRKFIRWLSLRCGCWLALWGHRPARSGCGRMRSLVPVGCWR